MVALATTAFAWIVFTVVLVGFLVYAAMNQRGARKELGSEVELAPNRKPYFSDEELEGPKLDRALSWGLLTLFVIGLGLPLYWIMEPGRQANAAKGFDDTFIERGKELFDTTENGGLNCAGCHGADGGGNNGPPLNNGLVVANFPDPADQVAVVTNGRGPMPSFGDRLSPEEIEAVVEYTRTL